MKKILLLFMFLVMTFVVKSQTFLISTQGTVDTCSGDFYDSGINKTTNGGKEAAGVYYYVFTVNYGDHGDCVDAKNFSGTITIIR